MNAAATRRDALRRAAVTGAAAIGAAATAGSLAGRASAQVDASAASDLEVLLGLIVLEQGAVTTYNALAERGTLGDLTPVARLFADQELEHVDALIAQLATIEGGESPKPPSVEEIPGLSEVSDRDGALRFAIGVENQSVAALLDAMRAFENSDLQETAGSIIGSQGQHLVVWRQALGVEPVPEAFPTGSEKT